MTSTSFGARILALSAGILFFLGCSSMPPPFMMNQQGGMGMNSSDEDAVRRTYARVPRVMLLVDEKNLGSIATSEVEAMGTGLLREQNVQVVDQDMVRSNIAKDQELLKLKR